MTKFIRNILVILFVVIIILITFALGVWFGKINVVCEVCPPQDVNFSLFWEAWEKLEEKYINPKDLKVQEMIYGAISGMVKSLEDPYTVFFPPEETKRFLEDVSGRFEGVGMEVGIKEGQLQVVAPLEGTPAQKAGLRPGDRIVKIDDELTIDVTIEEAVSLIRGPRGSEVTLTILRDGWETSEEFKIKRAVIDVPSLKWELIDEEIAYIKIYHFSEHADTDFQRAALKILESPAQKIILDLRSNPGGYLEVAKRITGWFLKPGQIVVIEDFGDKEGKKKKQTIHKARGNYRFLEFPKVILINGGTASASEILASALRDNQGVKIIGENSFGKGSVQELESLTDNSSLKITIADWLTPKGQLISGKGLEPDIELEMTEEDYNQERDPQLDKALEIIRKMK